jgi:protein PhnA
MAKGYDKSQERKAELNWFGKDLIRRCKSSCELCEEKERKLSVWEVPPTKVEPQFDSCIMICDECKEQLENKKLIKPDYWRFLQSTIWSEILPLQVISCVMLSYLKEDNSWAQDILDQVYLAPEVEEWIAKSELFKK